MGTYFLINMRGAHCLLRHIIMFSIMFSSYFPIAQCLAPLNAMPAFLVQYTVVKCALRELIACSNLIVDGRVCIICGSHDLLFVKQHDLQIKALISDNTYGINEFCQLLNMCTYNKGCSSKSRYKHYVS